MFVCSLVSANQEPGFLVPGIDATKLHLRSSYIPSPHAFTAQVTMPTSLTQTCCDSARCVFFSEPALVVNRIARFSSQPGVFTGMQDILQRMLTQCQARLHVPEDHSELQVHSQLQQDQGLGPGHSIGGSHAFAAANSISTRIVDYRDDCRLVGRELTARAIAQAKEDDFAFSVFDGF
jgi:hypothetical protein